MSGENYAYSMLDVNASISGPGGSFSLSEDGLANEGITVESDERVTTQRGAKGNWMHVLHASKGGRVIIRLMKNGKANALLSKMFDLDNVSAANMGQNTISIRNPTVGDSWTAVGCACTRKPSTSYATEGAMMEWDFNVGELNGVLGSGSPSIT